MLLAFGLIVTFLVVLLTGPYYKEKRRLRKEVDARPLAKVIPFPYPPKHPRKF